MIKLVLQMHNKIDYYAIIATEYVGLIDLSFNVFAKNGLCDNIEKVVLNFFNDSNVNFYH